MFKAILTNAVISKGYEDKPALRFTEVTEANSFSSVRFKVGINVYDSRVEGNYRWINISVKAFGHSCDRIKKMELHEGSHVNLSGRMDMESWEDNGQPQKQWILIVEDVELPSGSGNSLTDKKDEADSKAQPPSETNAEGQTAPNGNFTGFDSFSNANPFFPAGQK